MGSVQDDNIGSVQDDNMGKATEVKKMLTAFIQTLMANCQSPPRVSC